MKDIKYIPLLLVFCLSNNNKLLYNYQYIATQLTRNTIGVKP